MKNFTVPHRYLFKFYYIGSNKFYGSQRQLDKYTIEKCLLDVLIKSKYIKNVDTSGFEVASRTDKLVSARGAAFSFISQKKPILMEINSILPTEIGLWAYTKVDMNFSSRFNALSRHYKYIAPVPVSLLKKDFVLNLDIVRKACKELEGKHNFKNFSKKEKAEKNSIRDIDSVDMNVYNGYIIFDFKSKAFLRQQVRRMVKKLLELGTGIISYSEFLDLFNPSNDFSYQPADPTGLILWDVEFHDNIKLEVDSKSAERMKRYFSNQQLKYGHKHQLFGILHQNNIGQ
ncbi:MAG: tRNA pseudouridine synthase A [Promethearchaeota archaeon]